MRSKIPALIEALENRWGSHHSAVAGQILAHINFLDATIDTLTREIVERLVPFDGAVELLKTIPGISDLTAQTIIAEIGVDMSRFPTAGHLAAWAGVAPASHQSAGKRRPAGTRHGTRHLRHTLIEAARAAAHTKGTFLAARYSRIARRRGPNKAAVAIAHSILVAVHHMLLTGEIYHDLGADFFDRPATPHARSDATSPSSKPPATPSPSPPQPDTHTNDTHQTPSGSAPTPTPRAPITADTTHFTPEQRVPRSSARP